MPMYKIIEFSDSCSKTYGSLWQYCQDIPAVDNNNAIVNFTDNNLTDSFNFKVKIMVMHISLLKELLLLMILLLQMLMQIILIKK